MKTITIELAVTYKAEITATVDDRMYRRIVNCLENEDGYLTMIPNITEFVQENASFSPSDIEDVQITDMIDETDDEPTYDDYE